MKLEEGSARGLKGNVRLDQSPYFVMYSSWIQR